MWKYINTSDVLCHRMHKYIKRIRINGKWRYVYTDKDSYRHAKSKVDFADSLKDDVKRNAARRYEDQKKAYNTYERERSYDSKLSEEEKARYGLGNTKIRVEKAAKNLSNAVGNTVERDQYADSIYKKVENWANENSLSSVVKEKVDQGKNFLKKLLKK